MKIDAYIAGEVDDEFAQRSRHEHNNLIKPTTEIAISDGTKQQQVMTPIGTRQRVSARQMRNSIGGTHINAERCLVQPSPVIECLRTSESGSVTRRKLQEATHLEDGASGLDEMASPRLIFAAKRSKTANQHAIVHEPAAQHARSTTRTSEWRSN